MLPPDPTTAEWIVSGVAAVLVALVGGVHLVRASLTHDSPASIWGRAAALLLATATVGVLLSLVVVFAAGMRADGIDLAAGTGYPDGPLAGVLVPQDVGVADDVATYTAALLLPLAAALGILAVAVASTTAHAGFRIAAGVGCVVSASVAAVLLAFDTGAVVAGVATGGLFLFIAAGMCLLIDALTEAQRATSEALRT